MSNFEPILYTFIRGKLNEINIIIIKKLHIKKPEIFSRCDVSELNSVLSFEMHWFSAEMLCHPSPVSNNLNVKENKNVKIILSDNLIIFFTVSALKCTETKLREESVIVIS